MSKATFRNGNLILWLLFLVLWGQTVLFAEPVNIAGVDGVLADNLRLHLSSFEELNEKDPAVLKKRLLPPAKQALQALGYYHATIDIQLNNGTLTLQIVPGSVVTWGEASIQIDYGGLNPDPVLDAFAQKHPFEPGAAINHGSYDQFKQELLAQAQRQGFLDASLRRHELGIDLVRDRADVVLALTTGAIYTIAAIDYTGSDLSLPMLQQLSGLNKGDRYKTKAIGDAYNRLLESGYFTAVTIDRRLQSSGQVALAVKLQDAAPNRFTVGAGYGTDSGPRVKFAWLRPRLNQRGDTVQTQLELSAISQALTMQYRIPWHHSLERYLSWQNGWQQKDVEDTDTEILTTGIAYHRKAADDWQYSYQIDLERETYRQGAQPEQTVTYIVPGTNWSRTVVRGPVRNPDWGVRFWFGVQASSEALGSDTEFVRLLVGGHFLKRLGDSTQLVARASGGAIYSGQFLAVPASRRFFTGGDQSVRGFAFESLAPEDSTGELVGGQYLNTASLEFRHRWRPRWQWAIFSDTGRAYSDSSESFHTSVGGGLRWLLPVGTVAVDLAKPVASDSSDSIRLHLYMGLPL